MINGHLPIRSFCLLETDCLRDNFIGIIFSLSIYMQSLMHLMKAPWHADINITSNEHNNDVV